MDVLDIAYVWAEKYIPPMTRGEVKRIVKDFAGKDAERFDDAILTASVKPPRPVLANAAFDGPIGEAVRRVAPCTEADPAGILLQALGMFGNEVGRGAYYEINVTRHYPLLWGVTVGDTAKARKGTAGDIAKALFGEHVREPGLVGAVVRRGAGHAHHRRGGSRSDGARRRSRPGGRRNRTGGRRGGGRRRVPRRAKKSRRREHPLALIDEDGLLPNLAARRSWPPVGRTPAIGGHRRKVSVIGAVTVSPATQRLGFYFATAGDGYFSAAGVVAFPRGLLRHLLGKVSLDFFCRLSTAVLTSRAWDTVTVRQSRRRPVDRCRARVNGGFLGRGDTGLRERPPGRDGEAPCRRGGQGRRPRTRRSECLTPPHTPPASCPASTRRPS